MSFLTASTPVIADSQPRSSVGPYQTLEEGGLSRGAAGADLYYITSSNVILRPAAEGGEAPRMMA